MTQTPTQDSSKAVLLYVGLVAFAALTLIAIASRVAPPPRDWLAFSVLCALNLLSWRSKGERVEQRTALSFASIIILASVALLGPLGAGLVAAVSPLADVRQQPLQQRVFNVSMNSLIACVAALVYANVGGLQAVDAKNGPVPLLLDVGLPLIIADVTLCLLNAIVLSGVMRLSRGIPVRRFITTVLTSSGPAYVGYGLIGYLFVILWVPANVGPFSALLVLSPLFVARWAFVQYGDENNAHERTLRALVAAVETKDARTSGHSERVARLCDMIAGAMGMNHTDIASLRYAGMLHDVGILAVPGRVLRKVDSLDEVELDSIREHSSRGADIVRDIEFLAPAREGIQHHHERFDGRGYPSGLSGDDIPVFARIVAVADGFESLTAANAGRAPLPMDEALEEVERRAGSQFDPVVVAALRRALVREPWQPRTLESGQLPGGGQGYDHDAPDQSDAMADRLRQQVGVDGTHT